MADYYALIARAVSGLDPSAPGESRRALYERARAALIAQLRGARPELSESAITRERLSLEDAVRKVEAEAAQRAREATRTFGPSRGQENSAPQPPGMRGFRDIAADADDLGRTAAQANRSARKTYANVPSPPGLAPSASSLRPPLPLGQEPERQDPRQKPNPRADSPPKRFADSFRSRDALAAQAKRQGEAARAKADKERHEEEERIENERQEQIQRQSEIERATLEQDEALHQREEQEAARTQE